MQYGVMFEVLPGFRDFQPQACAIRNSLFKNWRKTAHTFGFEEFDGPILESLELFTKKSGEEIAEQLFAFEDKGGRKIALRPEMTPSLVRILGAQLATLKRPTKWFNITENFRYERPQKGRLRSFYQFNVDIVGEESYTAEAELIALAIRSFQSFGLTRVHFYIRLSDRQLWTLWLQVFGIHDEDLKIKMLALFDKWERRSHEEIEKDLKGILPATTPAETFFQETETLRQANDLEAIKACFEKHPLTESLKAALEERLDTFSKLFTELSYLGCQEFLKLDLSIVRGLAYYTGFVFEVFETGNQGRALAGGGRYDQLFEKLTGHPMPAVGFAAGDVTLTDLLQKNNLLPQIENPLDCYVVFEPSEVQSALSTTQMLRSQNISVKYTLGEAKSLSKQLKKAFSESPKFVLIFTHDELAQDKVQVKNISKDSTELVDLSQIADYLIH